MTASKRWRCYDAGRTSQFPLCSLASTPQLPLLNRADHASTKSIPRLPTSVMRSEERTPSIRPSRDAYFWAAAYYRQQRDKGCSHQAAVRALAFKWIRILYRCWQTRTPYDESTYLNALKRRGSPLLTSIAATAKNT